MSRLVPAAALAAGVAHAFGFAPTNAWWGQIAMLAVLCGLSHRAAPGRAAWTGWLFGLGWFGAGVSWVYISMHTYGGMPAVLAGAATLAFAAYLALFPAAALALAARLTARGTGPADARGLRATLWTAAVFAAAWTLAELARGWLFTGFPWLAAGYAHTDGPLAGLAPVVGVYGVGAAAALAAALVAQAVVAFTAATRAGDGASAGAAPGASAGAGANAAPGTAPDAAPRSAADRHTRPVRALALPLAAAVLVLLCGALLSQVPWTRPQGEPLSVRLVQGNVPQALKFDPARESQSMRRYVELIESSPATLTILPETAWTRPWAVTPLDLATRITERLQARGGAVAIGMPLSKPLAGDPSGTGEGWGLRGRVTNSVLVLGPAAAGASSHGIPVALGRYDKHHLVPFGEFVPPGFRWFVDLMSIPLGDFGRGDPVQPPIEAGGQRVAFNICYEDLFGEELIGPVAHGGATVLVNVSNIAWFGDSLALPQHLQIARMRALETGRPMLRATNTGMTAAVDARGRVLARLAPMSEGVLDAQVVGHTGLTPYVQTGNAPVLAAVAAVLLAALLRMRAVAQRRAARPA